MAAFVLPGLLLTTPVAAADWITAPQTAAADTVRQPIALEFRRLVPLSVEPKAMRVRVSADQRYVLYVNDHRIAEGPSRGNLSAWRYAEIDLAPYLKRGANLVAAEVWSDGRVAPVAQATSKITAFTLIAVDPAQAAVIDSGIGWQVRVDPSRTVASGMAQLIRQVGPTYYAAGGPETIDAALQALDWAQPKSRVTDWQALVPALTGPAPWHLVADTLPPMRRDRVPSGRVVRASGIAAGGFPAAKVTIPANREATLLVDAGHAGANRISLPAGSVQ